MKRNALLAFVFFLIPALAVWASHNSGGGGRSGGFGGRGSRQPVVINIAGPPAADITETSLPSRVTRRPTANHPMDAFKGAPRVPRTRFVGQI